MSLTRFLRRRGGEGAAESSGPAAAGPLRFEPVARSAFRTLGLAARASQREVFDAASSVRLALKLGVRKGFDSDAAWLGEVAREESDVRDALGRLSEPAQRAFERLFWFDDTTLAPRAVSNVEELERAVRAIRPAASLEDGAHAASREDGAHAVAGEDGARAVSGEECAALHDAALLALAGAMRLDPALREVELWRRAFDLWRRVFEAEEFWSSLVAADLNGEFEQLLTYSEARELRRRAPRVVSEPPASRARDAAARGDARECGRALRVLRAASLPQTLLEEYERESLGPLEDSLTEKLDAVAVSFPFAQGPGRTPATLHNYANAAWRRFKLLAPLLAEFAEAAGASHYSARRVFEHAASKLLRVAKNFEDAGRREEALFVALKAHALAPPAGAALAEAESLLRAFGAGEELAGKTEDEYAPALARELLDAREPSKLFKDDLRGARPLDSFFDRAPSSSKRREARGGVGGIAVALWLTVAAVSFGIQVCGVKNRPTRTYPGTNFPMPDYTPYVPNLNYNLNLNLDIRPLVIPPPLRVEPRRQRRGRRARTRDAQTRARNDNATLLPPPAPSPVP